MYMSHKLGAYGGCGRVQHKFYRFPLSGVHWSWLGDIPQDDGVAARSNIVPLSL